VKTTRWVISGSRSLNTWFGGTRVAKKRARFHATRKSGSPPGAASVTQPRSIIRPSVLRPFTNWSPLRTGTIEARGENLLFPGKKAVP